MFEGAALFGREIETALQRAGQGKLAVTMANTMMAPRVERRRRALEALFGLDHRARGEPMLAAPILTERHQTG